jgi:hypothetical protein
MPDNYEEWYKQQVETGKLPDKNGYYHYCHKEPEEEQL